MKEIEAILETVGDRRMNKYLIYGILESIVVKLVPEMLEKTPVQLLAERGVVLEDKVDKVE